MSAISKTVNDFRENQIPSSEYVDTLNNLFINFSLTEEFASLDPEEKARINNRLYEVKKLVQGVNIESPL